MSALVQRVRNAHGDGRILLIFFLLAAAAFGFAMFASEVLEGDTLAVDRYIIQSLRSAADTSIPIGPRWLESIMLDLTALGGVGVLMLLTIIVAGYLLAARKAATAGFVIAAIAGGAILSGLLKMGYARARPDLVAHLTQVDTTSFPSGHAMNSAIVYLTLGALLARSATDRQERIYLMAVAIALTLIVGFSRVYLGVHWPTDVLAGWLVGALWAAFCSLVARGLQRKAKIEPAGEAAPARLMNAS